MVETARRDGGAPAPPAGSAPGSPAGVAATGAGGDGTGSGVARAASAWLSASRLGLVVMALVVGVGAGFGAVAFRWLIFGFTWLATGHNSFGQQGRVGSAHFEWLGLGFFVLVPVVGGLIYGPMIQRWAREARGHGVPEVMLAVAENGGRIRPPVTVVKAIASALCIGTGGSVGREGPIVQIGSAFASTLGQLVRMSDTRLRVIVACGAAGGISATFNAPLTGLFFGFEIVLREFSLDALFATALSAVTADLISQAFFGSAPFFGAVPHDLVIHHDFTYVLVVVLGLLAGLLGYSFKTLLYKLEDVLDDLWKGRPEWARPAVGGVALGAVILAVPEMYGVGYPVMDRAISGKYVLWFLVVLMAAKMLAASVTLSIGGSGGVFAPSLFTGAMAGMAFGVVVQHLFGHIVSSPAVFAVATMGAVFASAAQAPLTAIASVVEMTGNFSLMLPVMLACGIASAVSKRLTYGSIYTTKLLRRGIDIERPKIANVLQLLKVGDVMKPMPKPRDLSPLAARGRPVAALAGDDTHPEAGESGWADLGSRVTLEPRAQSLLADETLEQALRQLVLHGPTGLPVMSADRRHLVGWVTRADVLRAMGQRVGALRKEAAQGAAATRAGAPGAEAAAREPTTPLQGYELVEVIIGSGSPAAGRRMGEVPWPAGSMVVGITNRRREVTLAEQGYVLQPGERVLLFVPATAPAAHGGARSGDDGGGPGATLASGPGGRGESASGHVAPVPTGDPPRES